MQNLSFRFYAVNQIKCKKPSFLTPAAIISYLQGTNLALGGELLHFLTITTLSLRNPCYCWEPACPSTSFRVTSVIQSGSEIFLLKKSLRKSHHTDSASLYQLKIKFFKNENYCTIEVLFWTGRVSWFGPRPRKKIYKQSERTWGVMFFHGINFIYYVQKTGKCCLGQDDSLTRYQCEVWKSNLSI